MTALSVKIKSVTIYKEPITFLHIVLTMIRTTITTITTSDVLIRIASSFSPSSYYCCSCPPGSWVVNTVTEKPRNNSLHCARDPYTVFNIKSIYYMLCFLKCFKPFKYLCFLHAMPNNLFNWFSLFFSLVVWVYCRQNPRQQNS